MSQQEQGSGCGVLIVGVLVFAGLVAAAISIAALVDPFAWMPPVDAIWAQCTDKSSTHVDECSLATRFPGFWGHAIANLAYVLAATGLLLALYGAVGDLREARRQRFDGAAAAERHGHARLAVTSLAVLAGLLGALPIVVAAVDL